MLCHCSLEEGPAGCHKVQGKKLLTFTSLAFEKAPAARHLHLLSIKQPWNQPRKQWSCTRSWRAFLRLSQLSQPRHPGKTHYKLFSLLFLQQSLSRLSGLHRLPSDLHNSVCAHMHVHVCIFPRKTRKSKEEEETQWSESTPDSSVSTLWVLTSWVKQNKLLPPNTFIYNLVLKQQSGKSISRTLLCPQKRRPLHLTVSKLESFYSVHLIGLTVSSGPSHLEG